MAAPQRDVPLFYKPVKKFSSVAAPRPKGSDGGVPVAPQAGQDDLPLPPPPPASSSSDDATLFPPPPDPVPFPLPPPLDDQDLPLPPPPPALQSIAAVSPPPPPPPPPPPAPPLPPPALTINRPLVIQKQAKGSGVGGGAKPPARGRDEGGDAMSSMLAEMKRSSPFQLRKVQEAEMSEVTPITHVGQSTVTLTSAPTPSPAAPSMRPNSAMPSVPRPSTQTINSTRFQPRSASMTPSQAVLRPVGGLAPTKASQPANNTTCSVAAVPVQSGGYKPRSPRPFRATSPALVGQQPSQPPTYNQMQIGSSTGGKWGINESAVQKVVPPADQYRPQAPAPSPYRPQAPAPSPYVPQAPAPSPYVPQALAPSPYVPQAPAPSPYVAPAPSPYVPQAPAPTPYVPQAPAPSPYVPQAPAPSPYVPQAPAPSPYVPQAPAPSPYVPQAPAPSPYVPQAPAPSPYVPRAPTPHVPRAPAPTPHVPQASIPMPSIDLLTTLPPTVPPVTGQPGKKVLCGVCQGDITGRYCTFNDTPYHSTCFVCSTCSASLVETQFYEKDGIFLCENCHLKTLARCAACGEMVRERLLQAGDLTFHPDCFVCSACQKPLSTTPFAFGPDKKPLCLPDYHRKFSPRCSACGEAIVPGPGEDKALRLVIQDRNFHPQCFCCQGCGLLLSNTEGGSGCYPVKDGIFCYQCAKEQAKASA